MLPLDTSEEAVAALRSEGIFTKWKFPEQLLSKPQELYGSLRKNELDRLYGNQYRIRHQTSPWRTALKLLWTAYCQRVFGPVVLASVAEATQIRARDIRQ
jgi:hypothetical protein